MSDSKACGLQIDAHGDAKLTLHEIKVKNSGQWQAHKSARRDLESLVSGTADEDQTVVIRT